jgi:hypothetical protein
MNAGRQTTQEATTRLHVCPSCESELVQPTGWERAEKAGWWMVERRCPECDWAGESSHPELEIDEFDERLDLGAQELLAELDALERANMEESAEAFIEALRADLVLPEDF